jgi:hypothetical protein
MGLVACIRNVRNAYKSLIWKFKWESAYLEEVGVDGRMLLKCILKK